MRDRRQSGVVALVGLVLLAAGCGLLDQLSDPSGLSIQTFSASPTEIVAGGTATLSWTVEGAETIEIDNGVGTVTPQGTRQVRPDRTTTYTLTARTGTMSALAVAQVAVTGTPARPTATPTSTSTPSPTTSITPTSTPAGSPTATPTGGGTATPTGSATPTPSASPAGSPTTTPTPTATATATATPFACGTSVSAAGNCTVTVTKPNAVPGGGCVELTQMTVNQACPVGIGVTRSVRFDVTAVTNRTSLTWRRSSASSDVIDPSGGTLAGSGTTAVLISDVVLSSTVTFEVLYDQTVILTVTLRHF